MHRTEAGRRLLADVDHPPLCQIQVVPRFSLEMLSRLQWNGTKLDCVSELINRPDSDLKFLIEEWDEADLQ